MRSRVVLKLAFLAWTCTHGMPREILHPSGKRPRSHMAIGLRSSSISCRTDISSFQECGYQANIGVGAFYGPTVWISLPFAVRDNGPSVNTFRRKLKTRVSQTLSLDNDEHIRRRCDVLDSFDAVLHLCLLNSS